MKNIRSYNKLINDVINLNIPFRVEIIGDVYYDNISYPILKLENITKDKKYHAIIQAGTHGDEAVGIRVLLKWLKENGHKWVKIYNLTIFPCTNPFGYNKNSRKNGNQQKVSQSEFWDKDLNIEELKIISKHYPNNPDLFIDIHADTGKSEVYIYERRPLDKISIASLALKDSKEIIPYIHNATVYKEICENGVIISPEHDKSIDDGMCNIGVPFVLTIEIPGKLEGRIQLDGGVRILNSIFKHFLKEMK